MFVVQLSEAHNELKDVKKQILVLGEQLIEEQEINKKSKELAASLERTLIYVEMCHSSGKLELKRNSLANIINFLFDKLASIVPNP